MKLFHKIHSLFGKRKLDAEMSEEMRHHVELQTELNVKAGMNPDEARYAALRQFGNIASLQEEARAGHGWVWLEQTLQDLRYARRALRRNPGFTVVAVASLALGIGANTALFSVVNELLLKPLPVPRAHELVSFAWHGDISHIAGSYMDISRGPRGEMFTFLSFQRFRENNQSLRGLFALISMGRHTATVDGQAEVLGGVDYVSGEYFSGLGVDAVVGRTLQSADDRLETPLVGMISAAYWNSRFGGDPAIVGKTITVNGAPVTIVGVTPTDFRGAKSFGSAPPFFLPLVFIDRLNPGFADLGTKPGSYWFLRIMGRLKPNVTCAQAEANFAAVFRRSALDGSNAVTSRTRTEISDASLGLSLEQDNNGSDVLRRSSADKLAVLFGLMGLMLLIACTNVATLLLARATARRREIAVRLALGAGRMRLIRQLLTENLLLAAGGGVFGVIAAKWGGDLLATMLALGGIERVTLDWRVLGFALAVSVVTGLLFGLAPALRATRIDLTAEFQSGAQTVGAGTVSRFRLGRKLIVLQVALSFLVLVSAGLFSLTLKNMRSADVGFSRKQMLLFSLDAAPTRYHGEQIEPLFERIVAEVRALPGVSAATFSCLSVVGGMANVYALRIPGNPHQTDAAVNEVGSDFFTVFDLPPILGRTFDPHDGARATPVTVINQTLAKNIFPGENPLGRHLTMVGHGDGECEIIGVVRDVKYRDVRESIPPTAFSPFAQTPLRWANFTVRTTLPPEMLASSVRRIVHEIDPTLPVADVRTQDESMERLLGQERMFAQLSMVLGVLALALVCVGLYGLMSYSVARRTNEIGVRLALGAQPRRMLEMILRDSLGLTLAGLVLGIVGAWAATRLIASMLYGIAPTDPTAYAGVAFLLIAVGLLASWLPARRAAKVDPMVALRAE